MVELWVKLPEDLQKEQNKFTFKRRFNKLTRNLSIF